MVQVLMWRLNGIRDSRAGNSRSDESTEGAIKITEAEFDRLFDEWLARHGIKAQSILQV